MDRQQATTPTKTGTPAAAKLAPGAGHPVLGLQRSAGNRAVAALLAAGQAKLEVGAADDPYEREADAVAHEVVDAMAHPGGQAVDGPERPTLRRSISRLQRREVPGIGAAGGPVSDEAERSIDAARSGGGRPLGSEQRRSFEGAMGADLSAVRLHSGPEARSLNEQVQARAFTVGSDIFLGGSTPDLSSRPGQELLAHELTHTVQQGATGAGTAARSIQRWWPWSTSGTQTGGTQTGGTQTGSGTQTTQPTPDPKVLLNQAEEELTKARQRLANKKKALSKKKPNVRNSPANKMSLDQLQQNVKDAEERRDALLNAPTAKSWTDLFSNVGLLGTRTGGGIKDDWTKQDQTDDNTGKNTSWWGTNTWDKDNKPDEPLGPMTQEETKDSETKQDEEKARDFIRTILDIPLVEINVSPDEIDDKVLNDWIEHKGGSQQKLTASAGNVKGAGKVEVSYGRGRKFAGDMGPALIAGDYFNSSTAVEGFAGAKGGYEYDLALGWERVAGSGKASAFAGAEVSAKTEVVWKIAGKEAGRFKGGLGVTYGVGGEIGGALSLPWGGDLLIQGNVKLALGVGFSYEIDFKVPTATWARWGYDFLANLLKWW